MGLSRNKVAVSEGAAGSPPFYGERKTDSKSVSCSLNRDKTKKTNSEILRVGSLLVVQFSVTD